MQDKKQSILIVDDQVESIELLARILGNGVEVLFARLGEDAIRIAKEQMPDLMLLDIMMPVMDGYQVLAKLKEDPHTEKIPVIFVTGMDTQGEEVRGLEAGAVDYITKPIHPAVVRARVRNHLELKKYRDFLENLSATDGLTGVANRRRFDEVLEREWRRGIRVVGPLSLLMMDIDCFKAYNDNYGHLAGDDVLRQLGAIIQNNMLRPIDLAARYGGEEFVCLLPDTDIAGAMLVAERIRNDLKKLQVEHRFCVANHVTVSIGIATQIPANNVPATDLVKEADENLYKAKSAGKDCIVGPADMTEHSHSVETSASAE